MSVTRQIIGSFEEIGQEVARQTTTVPKDIAGKALESLGVAAGQKQGQEVQITVRDTGIGIPEKDIPFIFERFFRGGNGNGTVTKGSGIGLTITKELTEAHGGRIEVSSAPGHGTGFTVRLPLPG